MGCLSPAIWLRSDPGCGALFQESLYSAADSGKRVRVGAGHGCACERPCRCAPEKPAARKGRAATRVSPFAVQAPGQTRWGDRKTRWADQRQAGSATSPLPGKRQQLLLARSTPLDNLNSCVLSRLGLLLRGQLDELGSFVESLGELAKLIQATLPTLKGMEGRQDLVDHLRLNTPRSRPRNHRPAVSYEIRIA